MRPITVDACSTTVTRQLQTDGACADDNHLAPWLQRRAQTRSIAGVTQGQATFPQRVEQRQRPGGGSGRQQQLSPVKDAIVCQREALRLTIDIAQRHTEMQLDVVVLPPVGGEHRLSLRICIQQHHFRQRRALIR